MSSDTTTFVGIDVAKDKLDLFIDTTGEHFTVANDAQGFASIRRRLKPLS